MENVFLTSFSAPEVKELFRKELESFFENKGSAIAEKPAMQKPINQKELASFLGITEPTVIRWRNKGLIPFMRIGSSLRYDVASVTAALTKYKSKRV